MTAASPNPLVFLWSGLAIESLTILMGQGWEFYPQFDTAGQLERVTGAFTWDLDGFVDAVRIKSYNDAAAIRSDRAGGLVWERDGATAEVLHQLVELPEPSNRLAPRLVRAATPRLWTP
jgi:hypothetical protein